MDGISIKLNATFGSEYKIYGDTDIEQGSVNPCFFIKSLNPSRSRMVGQRYSSENPFDILYFPAVKGSNTELQAKGSDLFEALETITLINGDQLRGWGMSYEVVDGVLHFFITYKLHLMDLLPLDDMATISVDADLKGL